MLNHCNGLVLCILISIVSVSASIFSFNRDDNLFDNEVNKIDNFSPSSKESEYKKILFIASKIGKNVIVKELVKHRPLLNSLDNKGKSPAWYAAKNEHWTTLALLIRSGATITSDILELEAWDKLFHKDLQIKELFVKTNLVNKSKDESVKVETVLLWSCLKGYYSLTEFLIYLGTDLNSPLLGNSHLWLPLSRSNFGLVNLLVSNGANIEATDHHGWTLLHTAALLDESEAILKFLLDKGLDVNILSNNGLTPLDVANGASWNILRKRGGMFSIELKNRLHTKNMYNLEYPI